MPLLPADKQNAYRRREAANRAAARALADAVRACLLDGGRLVVTPARPAGPWGELTDAELLAWLTGELRADRGAVLE